MTHNKPLTDRQLECFLHIVQGYVSLKPHTFRSLMEVMGMNSPNGVSGHVRVLRSKGFVLDGEHCNGRLIPAMLFCPCCKEQISGYAVDQYIAEGTFMLTKLYEAVAKAKELTE